MNRDGAEGFAKGLLLLGVLRYFQKKMASSETSTCFMANVLLFLWLFVPFNDSHFNNMSKIDTPHLHKKKLKYPPKNYGDCYPGTNYVVHFLRGEKVILNPKKLDVDYPPSMDCVSSRVPQCETYSMRMEDSVFLGMESLHQSKPPSLPLTFN